MKLLIGLVFLYLAFGAYYVIGMAYYEARRFLKQMKWRPCK